jgi:hypothetical protein
VGETPPQYAPTEPTIELLTCWQSQAEFNQPGLQERVARLDLVAGGGAIRDSESEGVIAEPQRVEMARPFRSWRHGGQPMAAPQRVAQGGRDERRHHVPAKELQQRLACLTRYRTRLPQGRQQMARCGQLGEPASAMGDDEVTAVTVEQHRDISSRRAFIERPVKGHLGVEERLVASFPSTLPIKQRPPALGFDSVAFKATIGKRGVYELALVRSRCDTVAS